MTSTAFPHSSTQEQPFQNPVSAGQPVALHGQQQPTPPPPLPAAFADVHTVKFTVCVDYLLEKRPEAHSDTNSTAARSKSTTTRKNTAAAAAANNTTPRAKKDDEYRSFYVSYALGAHADGKSPNLPPDAQQWTASHDVDVDARFLRDVLGTPLHVAVYENVRVEVEKRVGPGAAESDAVDNAHHSGGGLAVNLADNGLSRREQVRRVKAHSSVRAQDAAEAADEDDAQAAVMAALGMAAAPAPTAQGNNGGWQDLAAAGRPRRSLPPPARSAAGVDDASVAARPRASASAATAGRRSAPPAATDVGAQRAGRAGGGPRGAVGGVASDSERERERGDSPHPHHFHMRHGKSGIGSRVPSVRSLASLSTRATTPEEGTTATVVARDGEGGGGGGPPGLGASRAPQQQQQQPQQRHAGRRSETRPAARGAPPPPPPESRPDTMELLSHVGRTFKDVTFSETVRVADADGSDPSGTSLALKHKVLSEDERVRGRAMSESRLLKLSGDIEVRSGLSAAQQKRETEWSMLQRALLDPETTAKPKKAVKRGRERKPKTKIVIEIQRRLVGAVALELTDLFLGATSAATLLGNCIDGIRNFGIALKLNTPLLSATQERALNPLCITVLQAEGMPRNPVSFEQLDRLCAPTWARFRFFDLSEASYSCASELPHSTVARFHKKHVIFTGLIDQAKLAGRLQNASLEIEVHDRDYKPLQDLLPVDEFIVHENPFGVACFDLSAAATDPSEHRMSAPILPGPRLPGIPPGLWLESGALLHVKVQIKFPLTKLNSERRSSAEEFGYSRCLCLLPKWSAATSSSLNDSILRRTSRKEELLEKSDNVVDFCDDKYGELGLTRDERVSGFVFLDEEWTIFAAESAKETIKELLNGLEDSEAACFTSNSSSSERQWNAGAEPALQYFKVHPTLHQIFKNAKTYIKGHIPTGCFTFLMLLNKLINFNYIHRNQARSDLPTYEMLNTFAEAFGQELTGGPDFWTEQSNVDEQITVSEAKAATAGPITKRVDDRNLVFEDWLSSHQNNHVNVIQQYKSKFDSVRTKPRRRDRESHDVNNYSIQRNSVTARRMAELQRRMKKDHCYLYSDFFDLTLPFPEN